MFSFIYYFFYIVCQCFYVKHFKSALCMKSAISIKLPCLVFPIWHTSRCECLSDYGLSQDRKNKVSGSIEETLRFLHTVTSNNFWCDVLSANADKTSPGNRQQTAMGRGLFGQHASTFSHFPISRTDVPFHRTGNVWLLVGTLPSTSPYVDGSLASWRGDSMGWESATAPPPQWSPSKPPPRGECSAISCLPGSHMNVQTCAAMHSTNLMGKVADDTTIMGLVTESAMHCVSPQRQGQ